MRVIDTSLLTEGHDGLTANEREWVYNGLDCAVTLEILHVLRAQLDNVSSATYQFSLSLQAPILEMTLRGVLISERRRQSVLQKFRKQIAEFDDKLTRIASEGIGFTVATPRTGKPNESRWWRSPLKLKNLFYDVMGLPPVKKRNPKTGKFVPTVNIEALEKFQLYFYAEPIAKFLLALRDLDKKRGFLETEVDPDHRIRCNFNIGGTNTGRLSSSMSDLGTGTNLQNVDRELRSVFVAAPHMKFANLDLEQGDARNVGAICWNLFVDSHGEEYAGAYLNACESGDLHTSVCQMAWRNLEWNDDPKHNRKIAEQLAYRQDSYRQLAKKLGHGTNYYGTPRTMAKHTKVATPVIEAFQQAYFRAFPAIGSPDRSTSGGNYHSWVRQQLATSSSITTLFGRRRFFFGRPNDDATLREAIAYSPQSMTADEIDTGLINLQRLNIVELQVQVHDSILLSYPEELEEIVLPQAIKALQTRLILAHDREFIVPVDAKVGWNWGDQSDENPDGLVKWRGGDSRKRQERPGQRLSLLERLDGTELY